MDRSRPVASVGVLLVHGERLTGQALAESLGSGPELEVLEVVGSAASAVNAVAVRRPDVALVSVCVGTSAALGAIRSLRDVTPGLPVLLLGPEAPGLRRRAIAAGASGYLHAGRSIGGVRGDILLAARGFSLFGAHEVDECRRAVDPSGVTERELQVLELVAEGAATKQVARELNLSPHTVCNHLRHVSEKLGAHSRLEAVALARERGLID